MTYVLVSRDPKSGLEARIAVPDQGQARRIGRWELDAGRDLVAVHATSGEFPVTVEQIRISRAWSAHWRQIDRRGASLPGTKGAEREIGARIHSLA
jgi:hypothetical protein